MKKTGVCTNGGIWFGAAVSIAEVEAGCAIGGNWVALAAGHLLGGLMLFAAGLLGATTGKNAMETTTATFGLNGMRMFAVLNIVQLVGWTAVMIAQGGSAVAELTGLPCALPCLALAGLTGIWIFVGLGDQLHLATLGMGALAVLSAILSWRLLGAPAAVDPEPVGFWAAFEISLAMPLSWLPLIADYTSVTERPRLATAVSAGVYTLVSIWMYAVGVWIAKMGATSMADGIVKSGIGAIGLVVIIFSTVTTTFLDAHSSGESARSVWGKVPPRFIGVVVCAIGGGLAVGGLMDHYIDFLYAVSSVFAPMAAVLIVDRYVLKRRCAGWNLAAWAIGVAVYQFADASQASPSLAAIVSSATVAILRWVVPAHR